MRQQWTMIRPAIPMAWRSTVVVALAVTLAAMIVLPTELPSSEALSAAAPQGEAITSKPVVPQDVTYPAIAEHPLFSPTRQPWAPPPPPQAAPEQGPGPLADYRLVGVIVSDGMRRALVKSMRDSKTIGLAEGEQLEGWTLREIGSQQLRFTVQDSSYDMRFTKPSEAGQ
jgi:hypothetical protein